MKLNTQKFKIVSKINHSDARRFMNVKRGLTQETLKSVHIYVFRMIPKVNSEYFATHHSLNLHILHYVVQTHSIQFK